jgi:drug/metabolite transporter superfamily protein YnfA
MKIALDQVFVLYVLVFLAAIWGAWFIASWVRQRQIQKHAPLVTCAVCGAVTPRGHALRHWRCPRCGARNRLVG